MPPMPFKGLPNRKKHPLYCIWLMMRARCYTPGATGYKYYGGRGIEVCPAWTEFEQFVHDVEAEIGPRPAKFTLDRVDGEKDYQPGNIRWATRKEQGRHRPKYVQIGPERAAQLREMRANGEQVTRLAAEWGCAKTTVCEAARGKTWLDA